MDTRPSIIAAAAVLAAVDGQLTKKILELKMSLISFWHSQDYVSLLATSICSLRLSFEDLKVDNEFIIHFTDFHLTLALQQEHIYSCYNLMQEIVERKDKTPPKFSISSPHVLNSTSIDVLENSVGTKRRLTFSDSDDLSCPTKKFHRP